MKKSKFIFYLLALFMLFTSFRSCKFVDYTLIADRASNKVQKKLSKKYNMSVVGSGGGMFTCVYQISISFQIKHPLTLEEARIILTDCAQEIIDEINACKELRPYLKDYPATIKNIDLAIYSSQPDGSSVYDPFIVVASVGSKGKIWFATREKDEPYKYKNEYTESFEEAVAIVKEQRAKQSHQ